ncbi:hypothetical protein S245_005094, partial [Arachis hypogaea]
VLGNLKVLGVNNNNVEVILQSMYSQDQYDKLEHLSVSLFESEGTTFPHWFLENAQNLEKLIVEWSSFVEIFHDQSIGIEKGQVTISTRLKDLTLNQLHDLDHICKEGLQIDPVLQHLEQLAVVHCSSLVNLVPSSVTFAYLRHLEVANCNGMINLITCLTAKSLVNLATMKIESCNLLQDIMNANENEKDKEIVFSSLETLELVSLPRLRSFCSCKCSLLFPLLENVLVKECPRMEIFSTGDTSTPDLQQVQIEENNKQNFWEGDLNGTINKLFEDKLNRNSLEQLALNGKDAMMILNDHMEEAKFPKVETLRMQCLYDTQLTWWNDLLEIFPNVVGLQVRQSSMQTLFPVEESAHCSTRIAQQVRKLELFEMEHLKHIWHEESLADQLAPQNLESLGISACPNMVSVVSSSVSFQSLKELYVENCKGMTHLITSSIAKSLMQLEKLIVRNCEMIKDVVNVDDEEADEDIIFENLEYLELSTLISLRSFCYGKHALIFPSLIWFIVKACPQMEVFSPGSIIAPYLRTVEVENQRKQWKGDLNITIEQLFKDNQSRIQIKIKVFCKVKPSICMQYVCA